MSMNLSAPSNAPPDPPAGMAACSPIDAVQAAELQDHLLTTFNDLERLSRLLDGMCETLLVHFGRAHERVEGLRSRGLPATPAEQLRELDALREELAGAITGLQFQDMGSQLISHTLRRLRNCADRLAQGVLDDDEDGVALVEPAPTRPNPVTQDEMDAGSIELF